MTRLGSVYFIEAAGADAVKIGWAIAPERRLTMLAIGCPLELTLLAQAPATLGHEGRLQTMFAGHCIRGEWYRHNEKLDCLISEVRRTNKLPGNIVPLALPTAADRPGIGPLLRCIDALGSQAELARVSGTSAANVSEKVRKAKRVPAHWCLKLEAETLRRGVPVWRDEMRPDIYLPTDLKYLHPIRRHELRPDLYPKTGAAA